MSPVGTFETCRPALLLVGGLFLPDGLPEAVQLNRSGVSDLSKPAQGGVTTIGTFNYFAGDDPTGPVFLAASWKKVSTHAQGRLPF